MAKNNSSSWEHVEPWYSSCVGEKGHYFHQSLILPGILRILKINKGSRLSLLDLGCGQGILARSIPDTMTYVGIDSSPSLINQAKKLSHHPSATWITTDVTQKLPLEKRDFDCATFILSLQNMEDPKNAIAQARKCLKKNGHLLIVLNHPCFRIPRQSSWGIDEKNKMQYRRINRYHSKMKIPIQMHPGQNESTSVTYSFHHPLADYISFLVDNRLMIDGIEEWYSDKKSSGSKAKMEDRAREEIPLFLTILAKAY